MHHILWITEKKRKLTIVFPDLGGPEYLAVQPPVCSHSYLHVAASDPEKSQSISSIPLAFRLCKKRRRRVVHLQPRGIRGWGGPSLGWLLLPCRKDPNWWRQRRSPSFVSNPYVVPTPAPSTKSVRDWATGFKLWTFPNLIHAIHIAEVYLNF